MQPIPITVFTGFLGAGKTSIILSLLPHLPPDYRCCLLKNEFGDLQVDSKLANQSNLAAVSEILNGCMCCVLVGQMKTALLEIKDNYAPDRIIIECSGSAFPATLAFQIRELERETHGELKLDAIVTVIDAENFIGYEDTSPTAKMQASYTDMILINKSEHVSERQLDLVIDHLNTLNDETPKILCKGRDGVHPDLIFGVVDSKVSFDGSEETYPLDHHHHEVETLTLQASSSNTNIIISEAELKTALQGLSAEVVWRVKGFVQLQVSSDRSPSWFILNFAFGRYDLMPMSMNEEDMTGVACRLTIMGERGQVKRAIRKFTTMLDLMVT